MKIEQLIAQLTEIQKNYPGAEVYFTDGNKQEWFETFFQGINIDEEGYEEGLYAVEMLFDTEE